MRVANFAGIGFAGAVASGAAYIKADDIRAERAARTWAFWSQSFPIYCKYRYVEWQVKDKPEAERDVAFDELHDHYAPFSLNLCLELGGLYVKMGQIMSTRADFAPPQYMKEFTKLQDDVPSRDFQEVMQVLADEYGRDPMEIFEWIDEKPLGAATIGQVHAARVRGSGQEVVIKCQYPEISMLMENDFNTVLAFVKLAQPEFYPMFGEMKRQFLSEMDFREEGLSLRKIGNDVRENFENVTIPEPVEELCTSRICVMERVRGKKLIDDIKESYEQLAADRGMTFEELREEMEQMAEKPDLDEVRGQINRYNTLASIYNWTLGLVAPNLAYMHPPPNHNTLLKQLCAIQGHCVLNTGFFNGDLHPGNVLLSEDDHHMMLIDFGSTKWISWRERRLISKLVVALAEGTSEDIVEALLATGFETEHMNPEIIELNARFFLDRDDKSVIGDRNIQQFMEHLSSVDPTKHLPDFLFLPMRSAMLLRGLATILGSPALSVANEWLPNAKQCIKDTEWIERLDAMQEGHVAKEHKD